MNHNPYTPPEKTNLDNARSPKREGTIASIVIGTFLSATISAVGGFFAGFSAGCIYRIVHPNDDEPLLIWASQYGGWSALAHGVAGAFSGVLIYKFVHRRWTSLSFVVVYTLFGTCIGVSIGIAETIVPRVYLPERFWEAPFAAGLSGLIVSSFTAAKNIRLMTHMLSQAVATRITLSFILVGFTLAFLLLITGLAQIFARVDFATSTALRFLAIALIIALLALYVGYRRFRRVTFTRNN